MAHSYGAICSIEASRLTAHIAKMVLYEPPLPLPGQGLIFAADLAQRLQGLLAAGKHEAVVEGFLREVIRLGDGDIERLRRSSSWPVRIQAAPTIPREVGIANTYRFAAESFAHVRVPTLFLVGSISPDYMHAATKMASAAIAGSRIEELRGQGHAAMSTAPGMFVETVLGFLAGTAE
jgi:pimeloyl-ACP methyl ester carboxylesterase